MKPTPEKIPSKSDSIFTEDLQKEIKKVQKRVKKAKRIVNKVLDLAEDLLNEIE